MVLLDTALNRETDGATQTLFVKATSVDGSSAVETFNVAINDVERVRGRRRAIDSNAAANAINENATGTVGLTALASDADATNNAITYSLVTNIGGATPYTGPFSINGSSGVVLLDTALNRETDGATQTLFVKATSVDGSSAVETFDVAINDVPNSAPYRHRAHRELSAGVLPQRHGSRHAFDRRPG